MEARQTGVSSDVMEAGLTGVSSDVIEARLTMSHRLEGRDRPEARGVVIHLQIRV